MRTKEFIKRVKELGFRVREEKANINIIADNFIIAEVSKNRLYCINTYNSVKVEWTNEKELFDLIVEYAKTPIEDREEEKKFLIQHKYLVSKNFYPVCMVWHKLKDVYRPINCRVDNHIYQAQFTLKEVEDIKVKLDTDLADFELVEVVDEEM